MILGKVRSVRGRIGSFDFTTVAKLESEPVTRVEEGNVACQTPGELIDPSKVSQ